MAEETGGTPVTPTVPNVEMVVSQVNGDIAPPNLQYYGRKGIVRRYWLGRKEEVINRPIKDPKEPAYTPKMKEADIAVAMKLYPFEGEYVLDTNTNTVTFIGKL